MPTAARKSNPRLKLAPPAPVVRAPRQPRALGVVDQVRAALRPQARLATFLGALVGGFVPVAAYWLAHHEAATLLSLPAALVLGGLVFSAKTVYQWGRLAFGEPAKALGFVVLLEGVMITSRTPWLALAALGYLVAINAVATGCTLSRRAA